MKKVIFILGFIIGTILCKQILDWDVKNFESDVMVISSHIGEIKNENKILREQLKETKVEKQIAKLTAYSTDPISINVAKWRDGRTATNKPVKRGMVAADWSVYPPGTILYVPDYGMAVVEDRGSAVQGNHLDLFMETRKEALKWGVQYKEIILIKKGKEIQVNGKRKI